MRTMSVTFFNEDKRRGIAVDPRGCERIIRMRDCRKPRRKGNHIESFPCPHHERTPRPGDRVVCWRTPKPNSPAARNRWMYEEELSLAIEAISPAWRVVQLIEGEEGLRSCRSITLWCGMDLNHPGLELHFNPTIDLPQLPAGSFVSTSRRVWEVSRDGGRTWKRCEPPPEYLSQFNSEGRRRVVTH